MRLQICAVGRMRPGPEHEMCADYVSRFDRIGRNFGLGPIEIKEVEARKSAPEPEAALLREAIPKGAVICTLDERGRQLTSPDFAQRISDWRDEGRSDLSFVIGGADGLNHDLLSSADLSISFGKMVWPHMLVRVMLAEQLYRAASILAKMPYHRV